jgi:hypothetical protein
MLRSIAVSFALVALAVLAPATALGKGASEATIVGPGLSDPITLPGEGRTDGEAVMQIAEAAGFFPAVFSQTPDPMLDERPTGVLGQKYTISYVMPGPNNEEDVLVQELYPFASPSPVTYVEPGQSFWTTEQTRGGWYVASAGLKDQLVAAGLPEDAPPTGRAPSDSPWTFIGPVVVLVLVAILGGLVAFLVRKRPQTA